MAFLTMSNIADQIAKIQREAEEAILKLKTEAASGIAKKLAEAKDKLKAAQAEVDRLAKEYADATGKTIKGEKATGSRQRLSAEEKQALADKVSKFVTTSKEPVSFGDVKGNAAGYSDSAIRSALNDLKGKAIKVTGKKAAARYSKK